MYGRQNRAALDDYEPIPYERHARDYARAANGRGRWHDEYLVEQHSDGTVTLLPNDSMPYPGRQIWRRKKEKRMSRATIVYTGANGEYSFALFDRMTRVEGDAQGHNCRIFLDDGEIVETKEDHKTLRDRVEVAFQLRNPPIKKE